MSDRRYHHGNLREALLEQAERTVRERGTSALSLRELAREVGVSHAAPRRHFADRQALLNALATAGFDRMGRELRAAADGADDAFEPRLLAAATAYIRFATQDPALLELMFAGKHGDDAEAMDGAATEAFAVMLELIEHGQAVGAIEAGDPERVGTVLFATVHGIAALVSGGMLEPDRIEDLVPAAIANFLRGSRAAA